MEARVGSWWDDSRVWCSPRLHRDGRRLASTDEKSPYQRPALVGAKGEVARRLGYFPFLSASLGSAYFFPTIFDAGSTFPAALFRAVIFLLPLWISFVDP